MHIHTRHNTLLFLLLLLATYSNANNTDDTRHTPIKEQLGQQLFFDPNLSFNRTQSCATCHAPDRAFTDPRDNGVQGAYSLGDDGHSLGDRNAPTAAYAMFSPDFTFNKEGKYIGGQFHDGRENNLAGQAGGPPTNPIEMGMPNKRVIAKHLQENPFYLSAFKSLYGDNIFTNAENSYAAMADSIAHFERTELFAPFDSKYDRYLKGEYKMTEQEELGRTLFFSQQFTNCNLCHQLNKSQRHPQETFTNYEYHNIGIPTNIEGRKKNGVPIDTADTGLLNHPQVDDPKQAGKFKVPTLRNIAVTAPYMHNGVFQNLRTVVLFYDKYNSRSSKRQINPETGQVWATPEVPQNLSIKELETGPALDDQRVDALVAFMKTLTDKRYEHLLNNNE
ncbi:cytochrome-c peroxidase [Neptuniibacter marinus]|uniref:cytochrome-c peroxidase n=1 Tax=Neptuniibacter marinus TaxID=1806670 RepID=UPI003B59D500